MRRREFITLLSGPSALWPLSAYTRQQASLARIGILWSYFPPTQPIPIRDAFRRRLRELGYVEGQNVSFEERWAEGKPERFPALAVELVRIPVDVIVTTGDAPIRAAKQATSTIPIVMAVSGAPVEAGYVASLARPGGNITGLSSRSPELNAKLLELLKDAVPHVARVAVLWNAANPVKALDFAETQTAARALGITLQSVAVQATNDFDGAFEKITRERPDALIALVDEFINVNARQVGGFAAKSRLPAMFGDRRHVDAGGLMSYGPSLPDMFRRAAELVDKILKGVSPGDLPIEQPAKFEMVINRKAARALDLELSSLLLDRADEVIE
jgi:ABC-type uncharacterized transport system substrate-binding protein